jgi:hypothetical protein
MAPDNFLAQLRVQPDPTMTPANGSLQAQSDAGSRSDSGSQAQPNPAHATAVEASASVRAARDASSASAAGQHIMARAVAAADNAPPATSFVHQRLEATSNTSLQPGAQRTRLSAGGAAAQAQSAGSTEAVAPRHIGAPPASQSSARAEHSAVPQVVASAYQPHAPASTRAAQTHARGTTQLAVQPQADAAAGRQASEAAAAVEFELAEPAEAPSGNAAWPVQDPEEDGHAAAKRAALDPATVHNTRRGEQRAQGGATHALAQQAQATGAALTAAWQARSDALAGATPDMSGPSALLATAEPGSESADSAGNPQQGALGTSGTSQCQMHGAQQSTASNVFLTAPSRRQPFQILDDNLPVSSELQSAPAVSNASASTTSEASQPRQRYWPSRLAQQGSAAESQAAQQACAVSTRTTCVHSDCHFARQANLPVCQIMVNTTQEVAQQGLHCILWHVR